MKPKLGAAHREFVGDRNAAMSTNLPDENGPIALSIPPATLAALCERRAARRVGLAPKADRPAIALVALMKNVFSKPSVADSEFEAVARACSDGMEQMQTEIEDEFDAFLLDPGMGPMTYLTADGRILLDNRNWDGEGLEYETSMDGVAAALVVGAKKTSVASLVDLIPKLPNGTPCTECNGTRWFQFPEGELVCPFCFGRGECGVGA